ncbi:hypothetical protein J6590_065826 [Homalodisca vitripennis]|nr:hypothetical protein J6590_065826 [Homalodisca vitripennis]
MVSGGYLVVPTNLNRVRLLRWFWPYTASRAWNATVCTVRYLWRELVDVRNGASTGNVTYGAGEMAVAVGSWSARGIAGARCIEASAWCCGGSSRKCSGREMEAQEGGMRGGRGDGEVGAPTSLHRCTDNAHTPVVS